MKIGRRLFLAVLPAIFGVFAVAALAYWGKYGRQAPEALIVISIAVAVGSLGMAWFNTRYVARRVERLVGEATGKAAGSPMPLLRATAHTASSDAADELDTIESRVHDLNGAVRKAHEEGNRRVHAAQERLAEYSALCDEVVDAMAARLEEAQLPLHVLLSSPFGSLNENQEEMLSAAHASLDAADGEVRRLRILLAVDRGGLVATPQHTRLAELIRPALTIAEAHGRKARVTIRADISDASPRVISDAMQVQTALVTILTDAVNRALAGSEIHLSAGERESGRIGIEITWAISGGPSGDRTIAMRLARRIIELQHGTMEEGTSTITLELPGEALTQASGARR